MPRNNSYIVQCTISNKDQLVDLISNSIKDSKISELQPDLDNLHFTPHVTLALACYDYHDSNIENIHQGLINGIRKITSNHNQLLMCANDLSILAAKDRSSKRLVLTLQNVNNPGDNCNVLNYKIVELLKSLHLNVAWFSLPENFIAHITIGTITDDEVAFTRELQNKKHQILNSINRVLITISKLELLYTDYAYSPSKKLLEIPLKNDTVLFEFKKEKTLSEPYKKEKTLSEPYLIMSNLIYEAMHNAPYCSLVRQDKFITFEAVLQYLYEKRWETFAELAQYLCDQQWETFEELAKDDPFIWTLASTENSKIYDQSSRGKYMGNVLSSFFETDIAKTIFCTITVFNNGTGGQTYIASKSELPCIEGPETDKDYYYQQILTSQLGVNHFYKQTAYQLFWHLLITHIFQDAIKTNTPQSFKAKDLFSEILQLLNIQCNAEQKMQIASQCKGFQLNDNVLTCKGGDMDRILTNIEKKYLGFPSTHQTSLTKYKLPEGCTLFTFTPFTEVNPLSQTKHSSSKGAVI